MWQKNIKTRVTYYLNEPLTELLCKVNDLPGKGGRYRLNLE